MPVCNELGVAKPISADSCDVAGNVEIILALADSIAEATSERLPEVPARESRRRNLASDGNGLPMTEPFFRGYLITHIQDCLADPAKIRVIAEARGALGGTGDIAEMLPYLNAILPLASYSPGANTLTVKRGHRLITLYPHVAVMAKADDEEDALAVLAWLTDLINDAYARRAEIVPLYERRRTVGFLDVYRLLPGVNCKACGQPTCMAFAVALLDGRGRLQQCSGLSDAQRARLADLVPDA